jgi:dTDP-4-amino-4,6-dideoxygalactose transaminase
MKLAINGGKPVATETFPGYCTTGEEEKEAVLSVLSKGKLSQFLGAWHDNFYGGDEIRALEKEWSEYFKVKHAIAVNSCTSGLYAAVGAIGIEPGDEIIVSPYTMSASATAAVVYGGIPVFADVEPNFYCLDYNSVKEKITEKTKAIIVVDLFGQTYDRRINDLAKEHGIKVIEDTAQAPGAKDGDDYAGTLGDIGVFSLNYHKHIHSGEGGMIVTNDDGLAEKLRLIRNHAEAVVGPKGETDLVNMVGFNYRMTEIEAAISRCQLKKLDGLLKPRLENVEYLIKELTKIPAINFGGVRDKTLHAFYVLGFHYEKEQAENIERKKFIEAVRAELTVAKYREKEGPLVSFGYVKPLYLLPMYQERIAFGSKGYPFNLSDRSYNLGDCPVCEDLHFNKLITTGYMGSQMKKSDLDIVVSAFNKVWENRDELR